MEQKMKSFHLNNHMPIRLSSTDANLDANFTIPKAKGLKLTYYVPPSLCT